MKVIRWIIAGPICAISFLLFSAISEWILGWIFKILYFVMFWGNRYNVPSVFDFEDKIQDFKSFIFVTCIASLISAGISGFIGGKICPSGHGIATSIILGVFILPVLIISSCSLWNSDHWFYSSVWILDMIVSGFILVSCGMNVNEEN